MSTDSERNPEVVNVYLWDQNQRMIELKDVTDPLVEPQEECAYITREQDRGKPPFVVKSIDIGFKTGADPKLLRILQTGARYPFALNRIDRDTGAMIEHVVGSMILVNFSGPADDTQPLRLAFRSDGRCVHLQSILSR